MRPGANNFPNNQQIMEIAKQNNSMLFNMNIQKNLENMNKRIFSIKKSEI